MFDDSYPFEQEAYTRGYLAAETDLKDYGYTWATKHIQTWDAARDGFTLGYLTCLGVYEERVRTN